MRWCSLQKIKLILLSDLHFCTTNRQGPYIVLFTPGRFKESATHTKTNIDRLFNFIQTTAEPSISHIIFLGDIITTGEPDEFKLAYETILKLQNHFHINSKKHIKNDLNNEFITIIPGNHDLTTGKQSLRDLFMGWLRYATNKNDSKNIRMKCLLTQFKSYFSPTLTDKCNNPCENPEEFGKFEKPLMGTNIRLVPINSCSPYPVTTLGVNARGQILRDQLINISSLPEFDDEGNRIFRFLLMHHFLLPVVHSREYYEYFLEFNNANRVLSELYVHGKIAAIFCGHKHSDFIWKNSANLPDVNHCMPIVVVGTTTFRSPHENHRYCMVTIEDRDLKKCNPETTWISIEYRQRISGGRPQINGYEEFICQPKYYDQFISHSREAISTARNKKAIFNLFFDFLNRSAIDFVEPINNDSNRISIEFSKWGTRIYGNSPQAEECKISIPIKYNINGNFMFDFSCRSIAGEPEVMLIINGPQGLTRSGFRRITPKGETISLSYGELAPRMEIQLQFRSQGFAEIALHYLSIRQT